MNGAVRVTVEGFPNSHALAIAFARGCKLAILVTFATW